MEIAFAPNYLLALPPGHRFPMLKYELLPEQLLHEGTTTASDFFVPTPPPLAEVLRTHEADYVRRLLHGQLTRAEERASGFPWSPALAEREMTLLGGTIGCAQRALASGGVALNIAGGTHHAFAGRPEGFCLLNDQAVAANWLLAHEAARVRQVLIIDLDVHQGNGTAAIFRNEPRVFTFSMHGARNFPGRKEVSDLDLALPDGLGDAEYLAQLAEVLPPLLDEQVRPDFVFYLSGVDVLATDKLGHLALSREGCRRRDELVLGACHQRGLPVVVCMGGGYSEKIADIVEAHANTYRVAAGLWP
ncbi:histone deacetylase family protein [Hymenobacter cheonanensis]|uniref:histone deacetylase family protein n=1 Tax=Hymenobacter sp. CA2-7 TaxID=3063993 RepID=UPI002713C2E5|nr:histone deacetylase [Hymenobacter sp. CA2-7]MDO7884824.1 histone deacetylase [Hymenobacter sp. CA2-7]